MKTFSEAIQKQEFVVSAELNLAREADAAPVVEQATVFAKLAVPGEEIGWLLAGHTRDIPVL
jgi:hypothetical protein